jgi:hypothetical protein
LIKRFLFYISITLVIATSASAQKPSGTYSFHHQEMVASFNFSDDNRFEFFYSYGAVDRNATGTFSMSGDTIRLHSTKEPGKDFTVTKQSEKGKNYTIVAHAPNPYLLKHILAIAIVKGEQKYFESNEEGVITIDVPQCDTIYLQHTLFPDVLTLVKTAGNNNNHFEVELNPSLVQVSFKGIDLIMKGDELECPTNYFMPIENIKFIRE